MSNRYEFVIPASFAGSALVSRPSKNSLAATAASLLRSSVSDRNRTGVDLGRAGLAREVPLDQELREQVLGRSEAAAVRFERLPACPARTQPLPLDHESCDLVGKRLDRAGRARFHFVQRKRPPGRKRYDGRLVLSLRKDRFLGSIAPRYAGRDQGAGRLRRPCERRRVSPAGRGAPR